MNPTLSGGSGAATLLAIVGTIVSIVTTVFWMIVGWRAMRAHERIADKTDSRAN